jgi:hypothetical protein
MVVLYHNFPSVLYLDLGWFELKQVLGVYLASGFGRLFSLCFVPPHVRIGRHPSRTAFQVLLLKHYIQLGEGLKHRQPWATTQRKE